MSRVIVAVAEPTEVRELIRAGHAIAALWDAETVAVHISESSPADVVTELRHQGATLELHPGEPRQAICTLASREDVDAVVLGSGASDARPGVSRFTQELITELQAPILVVPPDSVTGLRRALVPLDDESPGSSALTRWLSAMCGHGIEVRLLHVLAPGAVPAFADHEPYASEVWGGEFLSRRFSSDAPAAELVREVGLPVEQIIDRCRPEVADLVVLSWGRRLAEGHARIVAEALSRSRIPVLLLAADR